MRCFTVVSIVVAYFTAFSNGIVCPDNFCDTVKCGSSDCNKNQIFVENGSTCGCCDACYTKLYEGELCHSITIGGGAYLAKCDDGLVCGENNVCVAKEWD